MHAFRRFGYHGVSIKDLEQETGLSSGSLYNSFGNRDAIFRSALSHYNNTVLQSRLDTFLNDRDSSAGLKVLFTSPLNEPDGCNFGCLLTNTAIEFGSMESVAREGLTEGFSKLLQAFHGQVISISNRHELKNPSLGSKEVALKLLTFYQGLLVLVRSGYKKKTLQSIIDTEFTHLFGDNDNG